MLARLILAVCLVAAPVAAEEHGITDAALAEVMENCLAQGNGPACIGVGSAACLEATGAEGPCLGSEAAYWETRASTVMVTLGGAGAAAEAFAARVNWPIPRPSLAQVAVSFAAYRDAACDMEGALWGNGASAGEAWMSCRMRVTAEHALRLEGWLEEPR